MNPTSDKTSKLTIIERDLLNMLRSVLRSIRKSAVPTEVFRAAGRWDRELSKATRYWNPNN